MRPVRASVSFGATSSRWHGRERTRRGRAGGDRRRRDAFGFEALRLEIVTGKLLDRPAIANIGAHRPVQRPHVVGKDRGLAALVALDGALGEGGEPALLDIALVILGLGVVGEDSGEQGDDEAGGIDGTEHHRLGVAERPGQGIEPEGDEGGGGLEQVAGLGDVEGEEVAAQGDDEEDACAAGRCRSARW